MARNQNDVTPEELESTDAEPLPDREAMSIVPLAPGDEYFTLPVEPPDSVGGNEELPVEPPATS